MSDNSFILGGQTLLPIIQADQVELGVETARAMVTAGANIVEVVLRSDASLSIVEAIKKEFPGLKVAAGTVLDTELLSSAITAGASIIVTPAVSTNLLNHLMDCPVPVLPGVSNVADILMAREYGYTELKLFPASLAGGVEFLKSVSSVFKDISFCPTGGVNQNNRLEYLSLPNVFAVGGTWVAPPELVNAQNWSKITELCREAL
ncbi:MAG: bifunctional 4-hydroxy-2-oxoglutarate aldolase/2-dehydro-3-deoxy-phosphogluconate aldolase [Kangiellaceae bacterium]|jgi:2-dehydro-3-deoxyphosphogluconate aldolase / (4S)-4-hydroxy-2-oxoglutarate aldolase